MPERRSALAAAYEVGRHGRAEGEPGVSLSEVRGLDLIQLGAWPDSFAAVRSRLQVEFGLRLPDDHRTATSDEGLHVFMIAPEKLWLAGPAEHSIFSGVTLNRGRQKRSAMICATPSFTWSAPVTPRK